MCFLFIISAFLVFFCENCETAACSCAQCSLELLEDNCTEIIGHIIISLESQMPPYEMIEYKLENMQKLTGCLTIANSGFTNLSFLQNLEIVEYSEIGAAASCRTYANTITIAKNALLRDVSALKNLKILNSGENTEYGLYLVDNPSLCLEEEELEAFLRFDKFYAPHFRICHENLLNSGFFCFFA
ncbi:unnamed protein product [Caenorhabditis angaria]|uniref:Receptor L-domain domain-containing protein n=1 Tax=Caenorhabditis angaria TaxID=860376 RepID=A0A9P1N1L6_9PELO|nr:unnamed protein product [Caenorhabditis angaria]